MYNILINNDNNFLRRGGVLNFRKQGICIIGGATIFCRTAVFYLLLKTKKKR